MELLHDSIFHWQILEHRTLVFGYSLAAGVGGLVFINGNLNVTTVNEIGETGVGP